MNYRHAYHAGNFADVFKHSLLARMLVHLLAKETPFRYMDTHAGVGLYDLGRIESQKTGESDLGIRRFLAAERTPALNALFQPYLDVLKAFNALDGKHYPGSPMVASHLLRRTDKLSLAELHPMDSRELLRRFDNDRRTTAMMMDGWSALKAWLPPPERRGMVLVDPPFEDRDELQNLIPALAAAHLKWPTGTFAFWYPVKAHREADLFAADIANLRIPKTLRLELLVDAGGDARALNGSGMIIVNPPWTLKQEAALMLPFLARTLAIGPHTAWKADWLTGE
ncbi:MAG: 23S rRNA (adenine(2030)-N(6))-methyltransferase RlmJ [Beijerinckiaceae bacterium]